MKTFIWSWRLICRWLVEAYFDNTTGLAAMMAYDLIFILVAPGFPVALGGSSRSSARTPTLLHNIIELFEGFLPEISQRRHRAADRRAGHHRLDEPRRASGHPAGALSGHQSDQHHLAHAQPLPRHQGPATLLVEPLDHRRAAAFLVRRDDPFQRHRHHLRRTDGRRRSRRRTTSIRPASHRHAAANTRSSPRADRPRPRAVPADAGGLPDASGRRCPARCSSRWAGWWSTGIFGFYVKERGSRYNETYAASPA